MILKKIFLESTKVVRNKLELRLHFLAARAQEERISLFLFRLGGVAGWPGGLGPRGFFKGVPGTPFFCGLHFLTGRSSIFRMKLRLTVIYIKSILFSKGLVAVTSN